MAGIEKTTDGRYRATDRDGHMGAAPTREKAIENMDAAHVKEKAFVSTNRLGETRESTGSKPRR